MLNLLRGLDFPPALVGLLRGAIEAGAIAAIGAIIIVLSDADLPEEWKFAIPLAVQGLRFLEGLADQVDPSKQRRP